MSDGLNQRYFHIGDASIRFVTPLDENGLEMLESVGFPQDVVPQPCGTVVPQPHLPWCRHQKQAWRYGVLQ